MHHGGRIADVVHKHQAQQQAQHAQKMAILPRCREGAASACAYVLPYVS